MCKSFVKEKKERIKGRNIQVVINGQSPKPSPIQGSVHRIQYLTQFCGTSTLVTFWGSYQQWQHMLMTAHSRSYCRLASQRAVSELNRQLRLVEWGRVAGQLCSGEHADDVHLTVTSCLSSRLRTGALRRQQSDPRAHQDTGNGRRLLPSFRSPCFYSCSPDFSTCVCPA